MTPLPTPNGSGLSQELESHWPEIQERSPCVAGVIPVIYYSILLGLGLPGEWGAGARGLGLGQKLESSFDGCQSSVLAPETQDHRSQGSPCLYGGDLGHWGTKHSEE